MRRCKCAYANAHLVCGTIDYSWTRMEETENEIFGEMDRPVDFLDTNMLQ